MKSYVLMTCCNTRYATVEDSCNHECQSQFSDTYQVTGNTGRHVDYLRATDQKVYTTRLMSHWGKRRAAVYAEQTLKFDEFARAQAELKSRQDTALMIRIMEEI